jgi:septum formation protein
VSESFKGSEENDTIIVIGADTIVACDEEIMGKPKDREDAVRMLSRLEGRTHQVYTGVTLVILKSEGTRKVTFHEQTDVTMYPMTMDEISRYVDTREPMDKAGAYAIQGRCAAYIKGINGDYNNVVGLPVARLMHEINNLGLA